MQIQKIQVFLYQLPLKTPLILQKKEHFFRQGLILQLENEEQHLGYGEVAPLPGFSQETLEECHSQLLTLAKFLLEQPIPPAVDLFEGELGAWLSHLELAPAVQFGLEMALLHLLSASLQVPMYRVLSDTKAQNLSMIMLLTGTPQRILNKVTEIAQWPHLKSVKLKVGRLAVEEDIQLVRAVRERIGSKQIRLDANRLWNRETALYFGTHVMDCDILYMEEPTPNPKDFFEFSQKTHIPIALDETLYESNLPQRFSEEIKALVVKPTLFGGIANTRLLAKKVRSQQIPMVISSSYESSLGLRMLANLAIALDAGNVVGLDTYDAFQYDLLKPRLSPVKSVLSIPKEAPILEKQRLEMLWESNASSVEHVEQSWKNFPAS